MKIYTELRKNLDLHSRGFLWIPVKAVGLGSKNVARVLAWLFYIRPILKLQHIGLLVRNDHLNNIFVKIQVSIKTFQNNSVSDK